VAPHGPTLPQLPTPSDYENTYLFIEPIPGFQNQLRLNPETPWIRGLPRSKVMVRPERIGGITDCMHDIIANDGPPLRNLVPDDLLVAHLPFTTLTRFEKKIANIRQSMTVHDACRGEALTWQWRRWLALSDERKISEEFARQIYDGEEIATLLSSGTIRSAAEMMTGVGRQHGVAQAS